MDTFKNEITLYQSDNKGEIILYQPDDSLKLEVWLDNDTVWLTQTQMGMLFGRDRTVISRHIRNIFIEGELQENMVCANFAHTTQHGAIKGKTQTIDVLSYSLDMIISVGYRVKSRQGIAFRQWASSVIKDYLFKGYAINQRFERLEYRVTETEKQIGFFVKTATPPKEGIFFDGQIFDAYVFIANCLNHDFHKIFKIAKIFLNPVYLFNLIKIMVQTEKVYLCNSET
jgi:hypothetical protein